MSQSTKVTICICISALLYPRLSAQEPAHNIASSGELPHTAHVVDTHIHLYDPRRPDGVPWPPPTDDILYKPHLPQEFTRIAKQANVTGIIVVEASDRLLDNQWVLDLVAKEKRYIGLVGNIDPYRNDFEGQLAKLCQDSRFVGIRARNAGPIGYSDRQVLTSFRTLAKLDRSLDILANGKGVEGVREVERLATEIPNLRIIVNHVLGYDIDGQAPSPDWVQAVAGLAKHPNVYCKISGLYQRSQTQPAPKSMAFYRPVLDTLWEHFGSKRLIYGSNWPVTKRSGDYDSFIRLVNKYFVAKGNAAAENYFWMNANRAYQLKLGE